MTKRCGMTVLPPYGDIVMVILLSESRDNAILTGV